MSCAVSRGNFAAWMKGKSVPDIMRLVPLPWRVDEGRVVDANGQPIAWIAVRLNLGDGDDSWLVIANKLAASAKLEAALARLLAIENPGNADQHEPGCCCVIHEARAALATARGEAP
jgi:hypothetical protein